MFYEEQFQVGHTQTLDILHYKKHVLIKLLINNSLKIELNCPTVANLTLVIGPKYFII